MLYKIQHFVVGSPKLTKNVVENATLVSINTSKSTNRTNSSKRIYRSKRTDDLTKETLTRKGPLPLHTIAPTHHRTYTPSHLHTIASTYHRTIKPSHHDRPTITPIPRALDSPSPKPRFPQGAPTPWARIPGYHAVPLPPLSLALHSQFQGNRGNSTFLKKINRISKVRALLKALKGEIMVLS